MNFGSEFAINAEWWETKDGLIVSYAISFQVYDNLTSSKLLLFEWKNQKSWNLSQQVVESLYHSFM